MKIFKNLVRHHQLETQTSVKIGVLKAPPGQSTARLKIAAVLRYPQRPDSNYFTKRPDVYVALASRVRDQGWTYVALVKSAAS